MAETQTNRRELVAWLQERVRRIETARQPATKVISSGSPALDRLLPEGGFRPGTLIEWLADEGAGGTTLALLAARQACRDGRALVLIDPARRFYPPPAARLGIDLQNLLVVCPGNRRDQDWALNQVLQSSAVGALVCWLEQLDERGFRRLQLAAEAGGVLGLLVRPANLVGRPSWAETQLLVESLPGQSLPGAESRQRLKVQLVRCRGGKAGTGAEWEIDDETTALPLAPRVAVATAPRRAARA